MKKDEDFRMKSKYQNLMENRSVIERQMRDNMTNRDMLKKFDNSYTTGLKWLDSTEPSSAALNSYGPVDTADKLEKQRLKETTDKILMNEELKRQMQEKQQR